MDTLAINRRALLEFMNGDAGSGHHTAVTGMIGEPLAVGLLLHYLNRQKQDGQGMKAECVSTKVTQGTKSGARLDAWIAAEKGGQRALYQTEIKMWAGNAIGGLRLATDADEATLRDGAKRQWDRVWDGQQKTFRADDVRKVLIPMKRPKGYEDAGAWPVQPLACFWWLMRSQDSDGPWFTVDVGGAAPPFGKVHVFSLTAYLLTLNEEVLHLTVPLIEQRLQALGRLFGAAGEHWTDAFRAGL